MTFTKDDFSDHNDPVNQDTLTDLVVLTRGERGTLHNVVVESLATETTPTGTEWALGTTATLDELEFEPLKAAANYQMLATPGKAFVMHLIDDDIYVDVTFLSWSRGGDGAGFSYERSTQD
jgi:hypothetical protein